VVSILPGGKLKADRKVRVAACGSLWE